MAGWGVLFYIDGYDCTLVCYGATIYSKQK